MLFYRSPIEAIGAAPDVAFEAWDGIVPKTLPWIWLPPGILISITVLAANFVGDGLGDALNPRSRRR